MGVWYECGNGMVKTKQARQRLQNTVFLCCPGPSLADAPSFLQGPRRTICAINTAYPKVRPDLWMGMDRPGCYDRNLFRESFPKYMRGGYQNEKVDGTAVKYYDGVYFIDCSVGRTEEIFERRNHDVDFVWMSHTLGTALHLLIWLGAKKIHLVGCDMGGAKDYYDDRELSSVRRASNRRLYRKQVKFMRVFNAHAVNHGVEVVSNTPDSPLNEFLGFEPLEESLEAAEPLPRNQLLHVSDLSNDVEIDPQKFTVACVLKSGGCYTPEYVERLRTGVREHLEVDHQFVCLTDFDDLDCPTVRLRENWPGWWSKIELFRCLLGETLYLDLDTIISGPLGAIRDLKGFAMLQDFYFPDRRGSGVMYWDGDYEYIYSRFLNDAPEWMNRYKDAGDQEYISDILDEKPKVIQDSIPGFVASYKASEPRECREASIVCYHGRPRPHETGWKVFPGEEPDEQPDILNVDKEDSRQDVLDAKSAFARISNLVQRDEAFCVIRFGDQEARIVHERDAGHDGNGGGGFFWGKSKKESQIFRKRLIKALEYDGGEHYFCGLATEGSLLIDPNRCGGPVVDAYLFTAPQWPDKTDRLWKELSKNRAVDLVCHRRADTDNLPFEPGRVYRVPDDAWFYSPEEQNILSDLQDSEPRAILIAAGPYSCVLGHRIWQTTSQQHIVIDIGSSLDVRMFNQSTRNYHREDDTRLRKRIEMLTVTRENSSADRADGQRVAREN